MKYNENDMSVAFSLRVLLQLHKSFGILVLHCFSRRGQQKFIFSVSNAVVLDLNLVVSVYVFFF